MSKKKTKINFNFICELFVIVLSVVAICMMFVHSVDVVGYSTTKYGYTGLQATFGYTAEDSSVSELAFSFVNLLPYIFILFSVVLTVLSMIGSLKGKVGKYVVCGLLFAAGVLFFLEGVFTVYGDLFNNVITQWINSNSSAKITTELATGAIVAGIVSILAAVCEALTFTLCKKKRK